MWKGIDKYSSSIEGPMEACSDGTYIVAFKAHEGELAGKVVHAIVWRIDAQIIVGWEELQQIKNEVFGPEVWAYEVFPAESCKVNVSNARHLWMPVDNVPTWGYRFRAADLSEPQLHKNQQIVW